FAGNGERAVQFTHSRGGHRRGQVVDVAELPQWLGPPDDQQPGRLEVPSHDGIHALTDQHRRSEHGQRRARVRPLSPGVELLELEQVADQSSVAGRLHRGVVVQRYRVVRARTVDHGAGQHHHTPHGGGGTGGEHRLCRAQVALCLPTRGLGDVDVQPGVDDDVHVLQPAHERGIAQAHDAPGDAVEVTTLVVDRQNGGHRRILRQQTSDAPPNGAAGTEYRDGDLASAIAPSANRGPTTRHWYTSCRYRGRHDVSTP